MTLDFSYSDEQAALAQSVQRFCEQRCTEDVVRGVGLPPGLWGDLAEVGVLALGTPDGGGGALEIAAAMEQLGAGACPGPLTGTFVATQLLDGSARDEVAAGKALVAVGAPPLLAWAPEATYFVELTADEAWLVTPEGEIEAVDTLGGEPWGRGSWRREERLDGFERAMVFGDIAMAAYLVGAGRALLDGAAEYAAARVQFRKAIGEFQAVAHPLADSKLQLTAAEALTRVAAYEADQGDPAARTRAAVARLSATRAGLDTAYRAHQIFGAMGFTVEGPVGHVSRRMRQISLTAPGPDSARNLVLDALGWSEGGRWNRQEEAS